RAYRLVIRQRLDRELDLATPRPDVFWTGQYCRLQSHLRWRPLPWRRGFGGAAGHAAVGGSPPRFETIIRVAGDRAERQARVASASRCECSRRTVLAAAPPYAPRRSRASRGTG